MKHTTILKKAAFATFVATAFATGSVQAQNNPNHVQGDIILFLQQRGGSQTVMVDLGTPSLYRDATGNILNIVNISGSISGSTASTTNAGYGATWYDDPSIFWGISASRSSSPLTTNAGVVDGDPSRTLYVSQARSAIGTEGVASSAGYTGLSNTDMTNGANGMIQIHNALETRFTTQIAVDPNSSSFVDDNNPFLGGVVPGTAFTIFPGGVMSSFGPGSFGTFGGVAAESAVDLYRILAANPSNTVETGAIREGQFQGSFVIDQTGNVSFIVTPVPEPATAGLLASAALVGLVRRRRRA